MPTVGPPRDLRKQSKRGLPVRYDPDHVGRIMHRLGLRERTRQRRRTTDLVFTQFRPDVITGAA